MQSSSILEPTSAPSQSAGMAKQVIIVGAGVAGLSLAQGLKKHKIPFRVFEQEQSSKSGRARYRIRLHRDSAEALQYVLPEQLWTLVQLAGADLSRRALVEIDARTANVVVDGSAPPSPIDSGPESAYALDSEVLLELLSRGLEREIAYGHKATSYEVGSDGGVMVSFSNARGTLSRIGGSLLVAADGVNSTIRKQLLPDAPMLDVGGWYVSGASPLTPALMESLIPATLSTVSHIRDLSCTNTVSMLVEPMVFPRRQELHRLGEVSCPPDHLHWVMAVQPSPLTMGEEAWREGGMQGLTAGECEQMAREVAEGWHPALRPIIEQQSAGQTAMLPVCSATPALPVWAPRKQLTLMGDAIHAMCGATGSGAATALRDAYNLCRAVVEGKGTAEAIGHYEADMRQYAGDAINAAFLAGQLLFDQPAWEDCHQYPL